MKIHITKDKKTGLFGLGKSWFSVEAFYELNDEERQLLGKNKHLLSMPAFDFPWRGPNGDTTGNQSATIKNMTGSKLWPVGCVFTNGEIEAVEAIINEGARSLKAELYRNNTGSSVTEI